MADRVLGEAFTIACDAAWSGTVTVTVTDPFGLAVATAVSATITGSSGIRRATASVPASATARSGVWTSVWTATVLPATPVKLKFTVAPLEANPGQTLWDLRLLVAGKEASVIEGVLSDYDAGVCTDVELLGGPSNYRGRYVSLHPDAGAALMGMSRRVVEFSGSALVLTAPFDADPVAGAPYALTEVPPREVDRALRSAFDELKAQGRVPLTAVGVPLVAGPRDYTLQLALPIEWVRVSSVAVASAATGGNYKNGKELVQGSGWHMEPGRKLVIEVPGEELVAGDTVTLTGIRQAFLPAFVDGRLDVEPSLLVTKAAMDLMDSRAAAGQLDSGEHMRRKMVYMQEHDGLLRRTVGRVPNGSVPVMP